MFVAVAKDIGLWLLRGFVAGALEMLVHQADGHRALSDGGGDAFGGSTSDVSDREHPRLAGLEHEWTLPAGGVGKVVAGEHEPVRVQGERSGEPGGAGFGADEDEQGARL